MARTLHRRDLPGANGGLPRVGHTGFGPDADLRYFDLHRDAE